MSVFSGTTALYVGTTSCSKAYVGDTQVWPLSVEPNWLTFTITQSGNISFNHYGDPVYATIEYSKNGGNWTKLCSSGASVSQRSVYVSANDVLRLRAEAEYNIYNHDYYLHYYYNDDEGGYRNNFSGSTASFFISGNILSMEYGSGFTNQTQTRVNHYGGASNYGYLFAGTKVIDAEQLILAEPTPSGQYYIVTMDGTGLFYQCNNLVKAPILYNSYWPGTYNNMFEGCSNLNYLKCLFEGSGIEYGIDYFMNGTASSGIFVKSANANWPRGWNGIPTGWTVVNE